MCPSSEDQSIPLDNTCIPGGVGWGVNEYCGIVPSLHTYTFQTITHEYTTSVHDSSVGLTVALLFVFTSVCFTFFLLFLFFYLTSDILTSDTFLLFIFLFNIYLFPLIFVCLLAPHHVLSHSFQSWSNLIRLTIKFQAILDSQNSIMDMHCCWIRLQTGLITYYSQLSSEDY